LATLYNESKRNKDDNVVLPKIDLKVGIV